jgi:protein-tyrosine-phosphatase/DNA-binding transcriptional ArsR family regulator
MMAQTSEPPSLLKLLAHDVRWQIVLLLAESDLRVQELVRQLQRPQNLVSYHLGLLRDGGLVTERRSSADGRDVYYALALDELRGRFRAAGAALHPALLAGAAPVPSVLSASVPYRVLFLCTHNSARSQLAEGILRARGGGRFAEFSAGSEPAGIHPLAIRAAAEMGIDISTQQSQHLDDFAGQHFDTIITVCDRMREVCPTFPDDPRQIHWSIPDPVAVAGDQDTGLAAFQDAATALSTRIDHLRLLLSNRPN